MRKHEKHMCKKDVLGNIKWQKQYLAFFLAIIYDVEHFFVGLNAKNNGFKWEENQFYYFYPSEGDHEKLKMIIFKKIHQYGEN